MLKSANQRVPFTSPRDTGEPKTVFWIRQLNPKELAGVMAKLKDAGFEMNGKAEPVNEKETDIVKLTEAFLVTVWSGLTEVEHFDGAAIPKESITEDWILEHLDFETLSDVAGAILRARELYEKNSSAPSTV